MTIRKVVALTVVTAGVLSCCVRPRLLRWGATDEEVGGPYPGADLVPDAERAATMAVTIDAPPEQVWPWLVQMGWDRGGWYSWDRLDNASRPSATAIHPEWQHLAVGDELRACGPSGLLAPWRVAVLEPNRFLGLHKLTDLQGSSLDPRQPRPATYMEGLWGFQLTALPGGHSPRHRFKGVTVMPTNAASNATALAREQFVSITTFKRNGTSVATPVWCVGEDDSVLVYSEAESGKVKRIRHNPHVLVAPCTFRGKPRGPAVEAVATISDDTGTVEALLTAKYRSVWTGYNRLMAAVRRVRRQSAPKAVTIRLTLR